MRLNFMASLILKEIPSATQQQAKSAARQIMGQFNIKEADLICEAPEEQSWTQR